MKPIIVLRKLHLYVALVIGLFVLVLAVTGAALVFENEIDRFLNSRLFNVTPRSQRISLQSAIETVNKTYPQTSATGIRLPESDDLSFEVSLKNGRAAYVNPYNGEVLGDRDREQSLARLIHLLHTRLLLGPPGETLMGIISGLTFLMALTGLALWWPRKLLTIKPGSSRKRLNFDLHNVLGIYSLVFLCVISITGVMIAFGKTTDAWVKRLNASSDQAAPQSVTDQSPAQKTTLTLDDAIHIANQTLPGSRTTLITVPPPGKAVFLAFQKFPEDRTPAGRSRVHIDQYSGKVLLVENTRTAETGTRILNLKRSLHTGDVWGWPTRICAMLTCLMLVAQTITGILIWWKPGKFRLA